MKIFTIACFCIFSTIVCKAIEKDSREIKYAAVLAAAALVLFHSVAFVKDLISVFEDLFTLSGIGSASFPGSAARPLRSGHGRTDRSGVWKP